MSDVFILLVAFFALQAYSKTEEERGLAVATNVISWVSFTAAMLSIIFGIVV